MNYSDSDIDQELDALKMSLSKEIEEVDSNDSGKYKRCLDLWIWITKALVLREHKASEYFTSQVKFLFL